MTLPVGAPLPPVEIHRAGGARVALAELVGDRPLVVAALRYFGCLPCLEFTARLAARYDELTEIGAHAIALGTGADYQAQRLMDEGLPFPALVDPDAHLYRAVGIGRLRWWELLRPAGARAYYHAWRDGGRPGKPTGDVLQRPGVFVVDPDLVLRYRYIGVALGDYPPLDEVIGVARGVAAR